MISIVRKSSLSKSPDNDAPLAAVVVWDLPLRIFHWLIAGCLVASWLTAEAGYEWNQVHLYLGYTTLTLISFRVLWAFVGTPSARVAQQQWGFGALLRSLRQLVQPTPAYSYGHSAIGSWASVVLLSLMLCQAMSGLFATDDIAFQGPYYPAVTAATASELTGFHHLNFNLICAAVVLHLSIMVWYRLYKKENLVSAMIIGTKDMPQTQRLATIRSAEALSGRAGILLRALICLAVAGALIAVVIQFAPEPEYYF